MKRPKHNIAAIALTIAIMLAIYYCINLYKTYLQPNIADTESVLLIYENDTKDSVISKLERIGIVHNINSFKAIADKRLSDESIKEGRYVFGKNADNRFIINSLINGWQTPGKLIIAGNIRSMEKLASIIGKQIEADSLELIAAFKDTSLIRKMGFTPETFPAMFIPNTYEVYWTISPERLVERLKKEYDNFWNEERLEKAKKTGLGIKEISTLASIVMEESNKTDEQPVIAGVYMNRLRKGIPLQADPTVKFALKDDSLKRILHKHLKIDSPYNTYKHRGLPPGPIAIPSISSIDAVLNYEHHDYLYFCADPSLNGYHNFAKTLREHNRNAREYRKAISSR